MINLYNPAHCAVVLIVLLIVQFPGNLNAALKMDDKAKLSRVEFWVGSQFILTCFALFVAIVCMIISAF